MVNQIIGRMHGTPLELQNLAQMIKNGWTKKTWFNIEREWEEEEESSRRLPSSIPMQSVYEMILKK